MNTTHPGCCVHVDLTQELCGVNNTNVCLNVSCDPVAGCYYPDVDCEDYYGAALIGDCQVATCETNQTTWPGCVLTLLAGYQLNQCDYCAGSTAAAANQCIGDLTVSQVAGISSGVLAAIIISVIVVCIICGLVGGKVGLAYYRKYRGKMSNLQSNPLYEDDKKGGVNPFFEDKTTA